MFPPFASSTTLETHGFPIVQRPYVAYTIFCFGGWPTFSACYIWRMRTTMAFWDWPGFLAARATSCYVSSLPGWPPDHPPRTSSNAAHRKKKAEFCIRMCPIEKVITPKITWFIMMFPVNIVTLCSKLGALLSFEHSPDSDLPALPRQSPELFQHLWWCSAGLVIGHLPWYSLGL